LKRGKKGMGEGDAHRRRGSAPIGEKDVVFKDGGQLWSFKGGVLLTLGECLPSRDMVTEEEIQHNKGGIHSDRRG